MGFLFRQKKLNANCVLCPLNFLGVIRFYRELDTTMDFFFLDFVDTVMFPSSVLKKKKHTHTN